jgi:undecaprenyl-diphosphatase
MSVTLAVILGFVQGLTEYLPVSSSGHLVVLQQFLARYFGAVELPVAFDVFLHLATLLVTVLYLRVELWQIVCGLLAKTERGAYIRRLTLLVCVATVPAVAVVLAFGKEVEESFSSVVVAANGFFVTALFLAVAHRRQLKLSLGGGGDSAALNWRLPSFPQALLIGLAQAVAILPGVSRSGSTIAAALILGLPALSAVKFSFYLMIPAVAGACVLELDKLFNLPSADLLAYSSGFGVTLVVGWFALAVLVKMVQTARLNYFALYTLALGLLLHLA